MSRTIKLIVFHADWKNGKLMDVGNDPCFNENETPSWGICRPPVRRSIKVGDTVIFLGYVKSTKQYFLKGWFEVGEKIPYWEALQRFSNRENVIIGQHPKPLENSRWRHDRSFADQLNENGRGIPNFLKEIKAQEGTFFQSSADGHEIDNWKCRRIFHCHKKQFAQCMVSGACQKDNISLSMYANYVVGHPERYADLDFLNIDGMDLLAAMGVIKPIRSPYNQLNPINLTEEQLARFHAIIQEEIKEQRA